MPEEALIAFIEAAAHLVDVLPNSLLRSQVRMVLNNAEDALCGEGFESRWSNE